MSQQIQITGGAKVRNLEGVLTGTAGVVNALGINVPSGIPQLDGSGKILVSQLPNSVMEYKGTWNAATNTPTLVNGTGNQGDVYLCNVAGTVNFGAGAITFAVGDQAIYSGTIWQKAGGSTGTVTSVAVTETGDALTITGSPITTSGTINIGFAGISSQYVNGAGGLTTFPSLAGYVTAVTGTAPVVSSGGTTPAISMPVATASVDGYLDNADWTIFNNKQNAITLTTTGTSGAATLVGATLNIPNYSTDLSGYVPYTGATANVNLGTFDLTADIITGATGSFTSSGSGNTLTINHSSGSGHGIDITKGGSGEGIRVNKTSGSGNAVTIIGTLNATTLVKDGGTSSQFLKADGSVDSSTYLTTSSAASTYVPYTGATANLNLGTFGITSGGISSSGIAVSHSAGISASSGATTINGDVNGIRINPVTASNNTLSFPASGSRTYTYPNATGTLALTSDIPSLSGYIQGSGTTNYVPKFTASGTIGNSLIYDTGTRIAIGGTSATYGVLTVQSDAGQFCIQSNTTPGKQLQIGYDHVANNSYLSSLNQGVAFTPLFLQPNGGNVGVGTTTDNGARFQVTGTATFSSSVQSTNIGIGFAPQSNIGAFIYRNAADYALAVQQDGSGIPFQVSSAGSVRMIITNGGNVGIGTSSPNKNGVNRALTVNASSGTSMYELCVGDTSTTTYWQFTGTDSSLINVANGYLRFGTADTERMRITSDGRFMVRTTSVLSPGGVGGVSNMLNPDDNGLWALALQNNATTATYGRGLGIRFTTDFNNSSNEVLWFVGNATPRFYVTSNGGVQNYSANDTNLSDIRTKKDIIPLESYWNKFKAIEIVKFKYKDQTHDDYNIGVIAQQVLEVAPEFVNEDGFGGKEYLPEDGIPLKSIYSEDLHNATIKVLQECMVKIEQLEAKVYKLENK